MKHFVKRLLPAIAVSAIVVMSASCRNGKTDWREFDGVVWHTTFHIKYQSPEDLDAAITGAMNDVEMSLSPFQRNSLISRINRSETDSVDAMISAVFDRSQQISHASGGMFDPTVAPLVNLWGFGYATPSGEPTDAQIDSCLELVGIDGCRISGGRIHKKDQATEFNFSAITKGFGCDAVASTLKDAGVENFMIEIGGEIALAGHSEHGVVWRIMIDAPVENSDPASHSGAAIVDLTDCAIATSGNYRNYRDTPEGRIGHTISPVTGRPVASDILSATIIAPDAMTADALATASMAMCPDSASAMIESMGRGTSAMFIMRADDEWKIVTTPGFPEISDIRD